MVLILRLNINTNHIVMYIRRSFFRIKLKINILMLGLLVLSTHNGMAEVKQASTPLKNGIFRENIRSVQFFREGWDFSQPVLELGADQR